MNDSPRQLNPFVFPSETTMRFSMLIITALILTLHLGFLLADRLGLPSLADVAEKVRTASNWPAPGTIDLPGGAEVYRVLLNSNLKLLGELLVILSFPILLIGVVFCASMAAYRRHPARIRSRTKDRLPAETSDPGLLAVVVKLARVAHISQPVEVELVGNLRTIGIRVFGFPKKYTLHIGGQWLAILHKAPEMFEAAVLHELAHIAHHDIRRTYFSRSLWFALVLLAIVPVVALVSLRFAADTLIDLLNSGIAGFDWNFLFTRNLPKLFFIYAQCGVTLAIVTAIWASLLRAREFYADWHVVLWGRRDALASIIERTVTSRRRWALLRFHPSLRERLAAIRHPERLFRLRSDIAFFVGFLLALLFVSAILLLNIAGTLLFTIPEIWIAAALADRDQNSLLVHSGHLALPLLALVVGLSLSGLLLGAGYLVAQTLGLEVQREAVATLAVEGRKIPYLRLLKPAALTALGLQVGLIFTPYSFFVVVGSMQFLLMPIWLLILICMIWLWFVYSYLFARRIVGGQVGARPPQLVRHIFTFMLAVTAFVLIVPALVGQQWIIPMLQNQQMLSISGIVLVVGGALMLSLLAYGSVVGATWAIVTLWQRVRAPICPSCKHAINGSYNEPYAIGQVCKRCGAELATWLFVDTSQLDV